MDITNTLHQQLRLHGPKDHKSDFSSNGETKNPSSSLKITSQTDFKEHTWDNNFDTNYPASHMLYLNHHKDCNHTMDNFSLQQISKELNYTIARKLQHKDKGATHPGSQIKLPTGKTNHI